jgi:hypothetical protein
MSDQIEEQSMGTKPVAEHAWLQNLVGEWTTSATMNMGPDAPEITSKGTESVRSLGGLWAFAQGKGEMPDGNSMEYFTAIGYDVSFNEYRGCWFADVSSHLWKYVGELSADGKTLTLTCEGPHMEKDGETAMYRDIHHLVNENERTMTSMGQAEDGTWNEFMVTKYTRVSG